MKLSIAVLRSKAADRYGEREFLVDRRRLHKVEVVERFSQISHAEYDEQSRAHTRAILIEQEYGFAGRGGARTHA